MLAAELFLANKNTRTNLDAIDLYPIKKIFMTGRRQRVDRTTIQEFASKKSPKTTFLQEWLTMPLPTTQSDRLNLPNRSIGKRARLPYVILDGKYAPATKKNHAKIIISREKKGKKKFTAELDLETKTDSFDANGEQELLMDKELYQINGTSLYEKYITNEIITRKQGSSIGDNAVFGAEVFIRACRCFFNFTRRQAYNPPASGNRFDVPFKIYLIPNDKKIEYIKKQPQTSEKFKDMTGDMVSEYASEATRFAKFLSFDDRAFTPNAVIEQNFYENIGIGSESLDKITIPADKIFRKGEFHWVFLDITKPNLSFKNEMNKGVFYQLFKNYKKLESSSSGVHAREAMMKVLCIKMDPYKSKMEILIDENLTMDRLRKIFENIDHHEVKYGELEILIQELGDKKLWGDYFRFVRSTILGHGFEYDLLIKLLTKNIRENIFDWIKSKDTSKKMKEFFRKTEFCRKILSDRVPNRISMKSSEEYAYKIGRIAGHYVWFRTSVDEKNNSFKNILTYSKYDRTKLRFVYERVSQGIRFVKTDKEKLAKFDKFLNDNKIDPNDEISDTDQANDYSYFFYSGLASTIGGAQ